MQGLTIQDGGGDAGPDIETLREDLTKRLLRALEAYLEVSECVLMGDREIRAARSWLSQLEHTVSAVRVGYPRAWKDHRFVALAERLAARQAFMREIEKTDAWLRELSDKVDTLELASLVDSKATLEAKFAEPDFFWRERARPTFERVTARIEAWESRNHEEAFEAALDRAEALKEENLAAALDALAEYVDDPEPGIRSRARETARIYRHWEDEIDRFAGARPKIEKLGGSSSVSDLEQALVLLGTFTSSSCPQVEERARRSLAEIRTRIDGIAAAWARDGFRLVRPSLADPRAGRGRGGVGDVRPFLMATHETSNKLYREFLKATGHAAPPHWKDEASPLYDDGPVTFVTVEDARAFCQWMCESRGGRFRLPTEREWEIAALYEERGVRRFPWGQDFERDRANVSSGFLWSVRRSGGDVSHWGVVGMAGNVAEFVRVEDTGYGARGGCATDLDDPEQAAACACTIPVTTRTRSAFLGFRVAGEVD